MARFLFGVLPTRGHVYPSLPIAQELRRGGHEVAYVTLPEFRHLLDPHGLVLFPLVADGVGLMRPARRGEGTGREAAKAAFRASFIAPLPALVRVFGQVAATWRPDVLVNDYVSYAPLLVAELQGQPVATLTMTVFSWPGEGFGPFGLGLPPARDAATRAHYATLRAHAEVFYADVVAEYNAVRSSFGLPPQPGPLAVATLSPYLQLVQTSAAFDYPRSDLPPQVHYVGPCSYDPPAPLAAETAAWLESLPPQQPIILVAASGAFVRSAEMVEAALSGLGELGVAVLATLPFDHPLHDTTPRAENSASDAPARVRVVRFVPHDQVLPRCAAVVTHGGCGTVTKALAHGVPLVVVPYAGDQPEVAQRVVATGSGLRLDSAQLTPMRLRDAVATVLHEPSYRVRAQEMQAVLAREDGPATAASLLERLAATRQPVLRDVMARSGF